MTRTARTIVILLLLAVVVLGGALVSRKKQAADTSATPTAAAAQKKIIVYAPCGMSSPISSVAGVFRRAHPEITLDVEYFSAPIIVRQIKEGAAPDVFMSPGELEMRQLVEAGSIDKETVRDFATLDLVIIAPKKSTVVQRIEDLTTSAVKTISLSDPKINSSGYYGEAALRSLGLWDKLQDKIIVNASPLGAVEQVTSNRVDAGVAFLTCPLETAPDKADRSDVRIINKISRDKYPAIRCQMGILKNAVNRELAEQFIQFMQTEEAQKVVATDGLLPIKELGERK